MRDSNDDGFERYRPLLMGIAYRMLGSSAEAEDTVQDTWLRLRSVDPSTIRDARAWLSTTIVRICIDRLTSARARRETYPGTWLPEPVLTTTPIDMESIHFGFMVLLERLDPRERAVFLLHRVFEYSHAEIAEMLDVSEATSRQVLHRAAKHVADNRPRFPKDREVHQRLLSAFVAAATSGDMQALSSVLAEDVVLYGDNAGKEGAVARAPIVGRDKVTRFFAARFAEHAAWPELSVDITDVNGWPALVGRSGATVVFVINIETDSSNIVAIRSVLSPRKLLLRHVS